MNKNQDVENNLEDAESIWKVCTCFCFIKKLKHSLNFSYSVESHYNIAGNLIVTCIWKQEVEKICRDNTEKIFFKPGRFSVVSPQEFWVFHHDSLVKNEVFWLKLSHFLWLVNTWKILGLGLRLKPYDPNFLVKIPFMCPHKYVNNIKKVTGVVQNYPTNWKDILKLPEACSTDYED